MKKKADFNNFLVCIRNFRFNHREVLNFTFDKGGTIYFICFFLHCIATGCSTHYEQTAFRIRSGMSAGLNSDSGWAGALNENVTVFTDEPFRIRFETVTANKLNNDQRFILQYRHNGSKWITIDAEEFPKPEKVFVLDFKNIDEDDVSDNWLIIQGSTSALKLAADSLDKFISVHTNDNPFMCVGLNEIKWGIAKYTVEFRFSHPYKSGAGIILGYHDRENYYRIFLDDEGTLCFSRFVDGMELPVVKEKTTVVAGRWLVLEVQINDKEIEIDFENDLADIKVHLNESIPQSLIGFYVPANSNVEFRQFKLEGEARTPPVSIVSCEAYDNGAETKDLLAGSSIGFIPGAGISLDNKTIVWSGGMAQSEWEWPLVIRRFSDGAVTNNEGDVFEFRMADLNSKPLKYNQNPVLSLAVPKGHIGGTFIETPGRIGPFQASNGDFYFIIEPAETDNMLMVIKSTDNGESWQEADGDNRPNEDDLEGFAAELSGHTIHMIHQQTNETWYHSFYTSDHPSNPDTWGSRDYLIATHEAPPTQVTTMAVRSDGSLVAVYGGPQKLHYRIRSAHGVWDDDETIVDPGHHLILSDPQIILGVEDEVHFVYYGNNGTAWYCKVLADGSLTPSQLISSDLKPDPDANDGSILPLVFIQENNTLVVIYQDRKGYLWEQRVTDNDPPSSPVQVSGRKVVFNAVDSEQACADAIAYGNSIHVLFAEDGTGSIFHTCTNEYNDWQPSSLLIDGINGSWIRGSLLRRKDGAPVYGFVYDAGSGGGGGMNKYAEFPLEGN